MAIEIFKQQVICIDSPEQNNITSLLSRIREGGSNADENQDLKDLTFQAINTPIYL